jgi:hypothetical protein
VSTVVDDEVVPVASVQSLGATGSAPSSLSSSPTLACSAGLATAHRHLVAEMMGRGQRRSDIRSDVPAELPGDCYEVVMRAARLHTPLDVLLSGCAAHG